MDAAEAVAQYHWNVISKGYAQARIDGFTIQLHRFVSGVIPDGLQIDHINRDKRDNRQANLRVVTSSFNHHNRAARGRSGFKGVSWDGWKQKWKASIAINCHRYHLGTFSNKVEAARAYDRAAIRHYGIDAVTNFPHKHYK